MKSKGKNVDVSLCDEASSDLPKTSEDVDVNLNISGAPRCDEAPSSSSSSSGPTRSKSDLISSIGKDIDNVKDFNLDDLMKHMSELLKLREKVDNNLPYPSDNNCALSFGIVPRKLKDTRETLKALPRGMRNWQDRQSFGIVPRKLKDTREPLKAILRRIGSAHMFLFPYLLVAETLEIFDTAFTNTEKCWHLIKEMYDLAIVLKRLRESAEGMQEVMQDATSLIIECARVCCTHIGGSASERFFTAVRMEKALKDIMERLNVMHIKISIQIRFRVLTAIQRQERSHLSKGYATHADNGQVEGDLLSTERQKAYIDNGHVEGLLLRELQKAYIDDNGQVEEDLLFPELQKAYIDDNGQVLEHLLFSKWQKRYIHYGQVEEDLRVHELQKAYIHNNERQKVFKMEALVAATNNFHEDNKVGEGGFGAVYKGTTHDGKQIAVKKMLLTSNEGRKQFMNEKLLAEVQHRNLVNLLGSCEQESQGFLVYEYLPNKSLNKFIFDPEKRKELDWHIRHKIILGIARGICYLHEDSQLRIVHRDIKTSNILLDEKLNPKIADFGTANLFPEDRTHVTVETDVGTYGYMPPEYIVTGKLSVRTDVYSFGIVLLELLTGEKISSDAFLERVWSSYNQNKVADTIDRTITETWDKEKGKAKAKAKALALRCFQVALLCIQNDAKLRPTMLRVTQMLSRSESLPVPTKPPLVSSPRRSCF